MCLIFPKYSQNSYLFRNEKVGMWHVSPNYQPLRVCGPRLSCGHKGVHMVPERGKWQTRPKYSNNPHCPKVFDFPRYNTKCSGKTKCYAEYFVWYLVVLYSLRYISEISVLFGQCRNTISKLAIPTVHACFRHVNIKFTRSWPSPFSPKLGTRHFSASPCHKTTYRVV